MADLIREGDWVLLYTREGDSYLLKAERRTFHTHIDSVDLSQCVGRSFGCVLYGKNGAEFFVLRPTVYDRIMKLKRATQIIYPKDIGIILLKLDVGPGKVILECGTGSGALTTAFAAAVGEEGRVISYEREERFRQVAEENLRRAGLLERVVLKGEVVEEFEEAGVDAVFLDVKEPWKLVHAAWKALKGGAPFGALVPTTNQVSELLKALREPPFAGIEVMEVLQRFYKPNPERLRPEDRMVAHTGFLVFARKVIP